MSASLETFVAAVVTHLGAIEGVTECKAFGGRFDEAALKRFGAKTPAVAVAVLRIPRSRTVDTGELACRLQMGAFLVVQDGRDGSRDALALRLSERLLLAVQAATFGVSGVRPAEELAAENVYSSGVQKQGVAIWGVTWTSEVRVGTDAYAPGDGFLDEIWVETESVTGTYGPPSGPLSDPDEATADAEAGA